jgi:F-type H+-transporting ATPase subunit b
VTFWTLINFAMFVALLGWGLVKFAPRFFEARSLDIQKAIKDATGLKIDADFRYSEIDKRMANLPAEVERLKAEARSNMQQVRERLLEETRQEEARIRASAVAEIEALRQQGQQEVRLLATQRAFGLAERRLAERFASSDSSDMLREFANLVERGKN